MKIEVGKTYQIDPLYKKSLVEIEQFRHEDGRMLNTEVLWRGGTFHIKITSQEEADELQGCIGEDGDMWDYESFEEIEMDSTFDGCSEDFIFYGNHFTEEEQEQMSKQQAERRLEAAKEREAERAKKRQEASGTVPVEKDW